MRRARVPASASRRNTTAGMSCSGAEPEPDHPRETPPPTHSRFAVRARNQRAGDCESDDGHESGAVQPDPGHQHQRISGPVLLGQPRRDEHVWLLEKLGDGRRICPFAGREEPRLQEYAASSCTSGSALQRAPLVSKAKGRDDPDRQHRPLASRARIRCAANPAAAPGATRSSTRRRRAERRRTASRCLRRVYTIREMRAGLSPITKSACCASRRVPPVPRAGERPIYLLLSCAEPAVPLKLATSFSRSR